MAKTELTPMMKQYQEAKRACPGALLLFRMGDFYEMFNEDAKTAAQVLGLALTSRDKSGNNPMPMAGFPHHQLDAYIGKLIAAGYRAAVCEQVEDPKKAKGLVRREVTRVVSPGTVTDETLLDPRECNYLAAVIDPDSDGKGKTKPDPEEEFKLGGSRTPIGLAWVELSTGKFYAATIPRTQLADQLARISPSECLLVDQIYSRLPENSFPITMMITKRPDWTFGHKTAYEALLKHFGTASLEGFGFDNPQNDAPAIRAAGAIIDYLRDTQKQSLAHIDNLIPYRSGGQLEIDEASRRSLEIAKTIRSGNREGSLLAVLDRCVTAMGSRLLSEWITNPLTDIEMIKLRQESISELLADPNVPQDIRENLRKVFDLERLLTKAVQCRATPRDLAYIARTLRVIPFFKEKISQFGSSLLQTLCNSIDPCEELMELLCSALVDENCPINAREGGFIKPGFNAELDETRELQAGGKQWIANYQAKQIERTGIQNLKVGYTRVFGYYLEVSNTHRDKIPDDFQRKQTIKNAERFITPELKEYEEKVLTASERANELEFELFSELRDKVAAARIRIQRTAGALSNLDVLANLAILAREHGYCRPEIVDEPVLRILEGRHPVLDAISPPGTFIPNDADSGGESGSIHLITGPNMAGKSTFIRQVALLTLMAQIGSYIPAKSAVIGVVDRIFARVGASDELSRGQSTFMVEMTETARILHTATEKSLVILDEIGRGTSTYDGISLAWAIVEHLHDYIGCRTFFATHYHELTDLADSFEGITNLNVAVREWQDEIAFLHKIVPGAADKSYGIHVARLAGVPREVIKRAREILGELEQTHLQAIDPEHDPLSERPGAGERFRRETAVGTIQFSLFGQDDHPILEEIRQSDPDQIAPIDALRILSEWKNQLELEAKRKRKRR